MANFNSTVTAALQSGVDLLVKGSARETPLSEDTIQRISPAVAALGLATVGDAYQVFRDNPYSALIGLVVVAGQNSVLSQAQVDQVGEAIELMLAAQAYETPLAEDVIEPLAAVAESSGFLTRGGFYEAVKDRPISTLLRWAIFLGSQ
jgi:hypothetical protein